MMALRAKKKQKLNLLNLQLASQAAKVLPLELTQELVFMMNNLKRWNDQFIKFWNIQNIESFL